MFRDYLKKFEDDGRKVGSLGKTFIANRISAAGVSYIVSEESSWYRRLLWFLAVVASVSVMGYMTANVVLEYTNYPKMLIREDSIVSRLQFPAVTVCSLNPISRRYAPEDFLKRSMQVGQMLNKLPSRESDVAFKKKCTMDPLCEWSWFQEQCKCVKDPCLTEFCLPHNDSHCICSSAICKNDRFTCEKADEPSDRRSNLCMCDMADSYNSTVKQFSESEELNQIENITDLIPDEDMRSIIDLVLKANTYDLSDIEEGLMPSLEDMYSYGITFDSLVASCSFEGNSCHRDNFSILYHPKYGKCYMFNYVGGSSDPVAPIDTTNYGSNSGLKLLLRVKDQENLDLVRSEVGARIVIHDPFQLPFVSEYGVDVKPMDMTAIGVSLSRMDRLSKPWGNCVDEKFHLNENEPYSILGCEKRCGFNYMTSKCHCTTRNLMHGSVLSRNVTRFPLCDLSNDTQKDCIERVNQNLDKRMEACKCQPPCRETIYSFSVTSSELNRDYYNLVKAIRTMTVTPEGNLTYYNTSDEKSMIGVKIYYNTFLVSEQREVKSYSWETLIANIGGNLGFFMGLSLITFLEILEFLWDVVCTVCKPSKNNKTSVFEKPSEDKEDGGTVQKAE